MDEKVRRTDGSRGTEMLTRALDWFQNQCYEKSTRRSRTNPNDALRKPLLKCSKLSVFEGDTIRECDQTTSVCAFPAPFQLWEVTDTAGSNPFGRKLCLALSSEWPSDR
jgi:hypothetical protein